MHSQWQNLRFGKKAEDLAARIYISRGFKILARNFCNKTGKRMGEIDIVAARGREIRFVEVKCRTSDAFGEDLEILTRAKLARFRKISAYYLKMHAACNYFRPHFDFVFVAMPHAALPQGSDGCQPPVDKKLIRVKIYSDVMIDL